jgi:hypothetical protein
MNFHYILLIFPAQLVNIAFASILHTHNTFDAVAFDVVRGVSKKRQALCAVCCAWN